MSAYEVFTLLSAALTIGVAGWAWWRHRRASERSGGVVPRRLVRARPFLAVFLPLMGLLMCLQLYLEQGGAGWLVLAALCAVGVLVGIASAREGFHSGPPGAAGPPGASRRGSPGRGLPGRGLPR